MNKKQRTIFMIMLGMLAAAFVYFSLRAERRWADIRTACAAYDEIHRMRPDQIVNCPYD